MGPAKLLILSLALVSLGGCATMGPVNSLKPTCSALIGPIKYNSFNVKSRRHAGPDLALDLKARNQVGRWLGCSQYR